MIPSTPPAFFGFVQLDNALAFDAFCAKKRELLERDGARIVDDLTSGRLALSSVAWHPYGFVVFILSTSATEGTLRVHFWPKGRRKVWARHPTIHCHDWHLASLVLAGTYRERLFNQAGPGGGEGHGTRIATYVVTKNEAGDDVRWPSTDSIALRPGVLESYQAKAMHFIPARTFHATMIPRSLVCVTVLVTSPRIVATPVIAGRAGLPGAVYRRPVLSGRERDSILARLRAAVFGDSGNGKADR
jgi:hypothetical protein